MSDSLRCPYCGWTGAARRTETLCVDVPTDAPAAAGRGPMVRQIDKYECEVCRQVWEDECFRRPQSAGARRADGRQPRPAAASHEP